MHTMHMPHLPDALNTFQLISMKFVPKGPIYNISALVQMMAWRRPGDKPLSEPMIFSLTTHICATRLKWVNFGRMCNDLGYLVMAMCIFNFPELVTLLYTHSFFPLFRCPNIAMEVGSIRIR